MNQQHFKYIASLSRHLSFGTAARECGVNQSTLSIQLKKIEAELGIQLFERTNKSVKVAPAARELIIEARRISTLIDDFVATANKLADPENQTVTLAGFPTIASYILPTYALKLRQHFPQLKIHLAEYKTEQILELLQAQKIDCAVLAETEESNSLTVSPLFTDRFYLAVSGTHELFSKKTISHEQINYSDMMLLEEGHCLRDQTLNLCRKSPEKLKQNFKATSIETLLAMVANGAGTTLVPEIIAEQYRRQNPVVNLNFLRVTGSELYARKICLVWRKSAANQAFYHEIAEIFKG